MGKTYDEITKGEIEAGSKCLGPNLNKNMVYGTGVDYKLTLCPLQSRLQHIYHGKPYARIDLNSMPESTLSPGQGLWIWPLSPKLRTF
jgi:hypothetical protein